MVRRQLSLIFLLLWLFFLEGCASFGVYNAATGRRELIVIPIDVEVTMGQDVHKAIVSKYHLSGREDQLLRLNNIGQRISQISDRQDYEYHFYLIEKDEMNAFTTPGGNIYFFSGLLDKFETDDEIAAVLAHEIGHCAAAHVIKKYQAALGYNIIGGLVFRQLSLKEKTQKLVLAGSNTIMELISSAYSRSDEYEADQLGLKYMFLAGYDINGMIKTLEILHKEAKRSKTPLLLRTHPYLEDRISAVKKEIHSIEAGTQGEPNTNLYWH